MNPHYRGYEDFEYDGGKQSPDYAVNQQDKARINAMNQEDREFLRLVRGMDSKLPSDILYYGIGDFLGKEGRYVMGSSFSNAQDQLTRDLSRMGTGAIAGYYDRHGGDIAFGMLQQRKDQDRHGVFNELMTVDSPVIIDLYPNKLDDILVTATKDRKEAIVASLMDRLPVDEFLKLVDRNRR